MISGSKNIFSILIRFAFLNQILCDTQTVSNVTVKVMGQSGKIEITETNIVGNETKYDKVNIRFGSITERDANGNAIGTSGDIKHSYNNFAGLNFTVSSPYLLNYQNISCYSIDFNASNLVVPTDSLYGTVLIFAGNGTIKTSLTENVDVSPGFVKFTLEVGQWPFCKNITPCIGANCCLGKNNTNEIGAFLDVELEINGNSTAKKHSDGVYNLGNSKLILSNYIFVDDKELNLPKGYPTFINKSNTTDVLTVRFPAFNQYAIYDPVIEMEIPKPNQGNIIIIVVITVLLVILIAGIIYFACTRKKKVNNTLIESKL